MVQMTGLQRLGDQLDAIDQALQVAREETRPERREQLLELVGRAVTAARAEHQAAEDEQRSRPALRLIQGGGLAALLAGLGAGVRAYWQQHRAAYAASVTATTAAASLLALSVERGPGVRHDAEEPTPTVSVTQGERQRENLAPPPPPAPSQTIQGPGLRPTATPAAVGGPVGGDHLVAACVESTALLPGLERPPSSEGLCVRVSASPVAPRAVRAGEEAGDGPPSRDRLCIYVTAPPAAKADACLRSG